MAGVNVGQDFLKYEIFEIGTFRSVYLSSRLWIYVKPFLNGRQNVRADIKAAIDNAASQWLENCN